MNSYDILHKLRNHNIELNLSIAFLNIKLCPFLYALSLVWNILDVNKNISNMSHKAKGLGRNRCRNKKRIVIARQKTSGKKQRLQCVLHEARSNSRILLFR
jgi:hypothetical protein